MLNAYETKKLNICLMARVIFWAKLDHCSKCNKLISKARVTLMECFLLAFWLIFLFIYPKASVHTECHN